MVALCFIEWRQTGELSQVFLEMVRRASGLSSGRSLIELSAWRDGSFVEVRQEGDKSANAFR
jgi:hypothetical protein